jgi:hypothetical protein
MLEKLSQSSGNILGYKVIGKITKDDYKTLSADIDALGQEISIGLLLDMAAFTGEEIKAQLEKIKFRSDHQKKIAKLAVVADRKMHHWYLAFINQYNYTLETEFFPSEERIAAWEWLQT